jgi:hypothetical protein
MNYRKIIETAIECEKLEARLHICQQLYPRLYSAVEQAETTDVMFNIETALQHNHDRLKQLVEEAE